MCGRFALPDNRESIIEAFDIATNIQVEPAHLLTPRYNIAPTDQIPVVISNKGERNIASMRWGLIPFRTDGLKGRTAIDKQGKYVNTPINARAETVDSNGSFKRSFEKRRCIIPAGGFYEWKRNGPTKIPHWITSSESPWMGFAGLYTWWKSPDSKWIPSCSIITTSANDFMEPIHDRMPVILPEGAYDLWLNQDTQDLSVLKEVLVPYPSVKMKAHPVSSLVNKVSNEGPDLINEVQFNSPTLI